MDYQTAKDIDGKHSLKHCLMFQLTRISREKGALAHDDRLDVLAMGVASFAEIMAINEQENMDYLMEEFLTDHLERNIQNTVITAKRAEIGNITIDWEDDGYDNLNILSGRNNGWV